MLALGRVTPATLDVLEALLDAVDPVWGLRLVKATGRPAGSVYPILERLERAGWVKSAWDEYDSRSGPRRRLYRVTAEGAAQARELLVARRRAVPNLIGRTVEP